MIPRIATKIVIILLVVCTINCFWNLRQATNGGVTDAWMNYNISNSIDMRKDSGSANSTTKASNTSTSVAWYPSKEWVENCTDDLSAQTEPLGEWNHPYGSVTLGDCIKFCRCPKRKKTFFNSMYTQKACPLSKYGSETFNMSKIDEVHEIQSHLPNFTIPEPDALVIHLRLGDVVELSKPKTVDILMNGGDPGHLGGRKNYHLAIKSIRELLDNIRSSGAKKVRIVGGSHKENHWRKSRVYAGCIHRAIKTAGYDVTMRVEGIHPDVDFYYISHAKRLVVAAGGYSNIMGRLVEFRGGHMVGRSFGVNWKGPPENKDNAIVSPVHNDVEAETKL